MTDQDQRPAGWKKDPTGRHFGRWWDGRQWTQHVISPEKVPSIDPAPWRLVTADQSTSQLRAGWKRDPYGRHFGRYWDGEGWTQHVISAQKVQRIDSLPPNPETSTLPDRAPGSMPPDLNRPPSEAAHSTGAPTRHTAREVHSHLFRTRETTGGWWGHRSRVQKGVLVVVAAFLLLYVVGAITGTDTGTTIDTAGRNSAQPTESADTSEGRDPPSTTAGKAPLTGTEAGIAKGVPAGGNDSTVERIIDGDTLVAAGGTHIRLIGIDTPETVEPGSPVQCFGPEATRYANELMPVGTRIRLIYDVERLDRYGRTLAYVYKLDDGLFVNHALARNGFAQQLTVPPNVAHAEEFRVAVADARNASLGLWRRCQTTTSLSETAGATRPAITPSVVTAAPTTLREAAPAQTPGCHPSYEGACVPTGFSDVDCAGGAGNGPGYVSGKNFRVVGPDVYDLDGNDNDGIACESR